jgi:peptide/nickel transport system ATP-binding protein
MLELNHVSARYNMLTSYVNAVDDVNFTVEDNEIFGIAGESGCGKSTLLKVMYDLLKYPLEISSGSVRLYKSGSKDEYVESGNLREYWWKEISYVPQGAMHVMNPVTRIETQFFDTVSRGYHEKMTKKQLRERITEYLEELELPASVLRAYPHQLSGGMRQRVLIALATFLNPGVILADEPTTALDVVVQKDILTMLMSVQKRMKNSMVIVSHDMGVHYQVTTRMGIMYAGQMIEIGPTDEIFNNPKHPYTQMLIGALPKVGDNSQKEGIPGTPPSLKDPPAGCRFAARCKYATEECRKIQPQTTQVGEKHFAACLRLSQNGGGVQNGK